MQCACAPELMQMLVLLLLLLPPLPLVLPALAHSPHSPQRAPPQPTNFTVQSATSTEIQLTWVEESSKNTTAQPAVQQNSPDATETSKQKKKTHEHIHYILHYKKTKENLINNITLGREGFDEVGNFRFTLKELDPETEYRLWVSAFFANDPGEMYPNITYSEPSENKTQSTDVMPPSAPDISNAFCDQPPNTLSLQWKKPEKNFKNLASYVIKMKKKDSSEKPLTLSVDTSDDQLEVSISMDVEIKNNKSIYEVILFAQSASSIYHGHLINGTETKPQEVVMTPDCVAAIPSSESLTSPMLGIIFVIIALIIIVLLALMVLYRRSCAALFKQCYPMSYLFLEEGVPIGGDGCGENGMSGMADSQINCPNKAIISPTHAVVFWGAIENKNNAEINNELLWDALHPPVAADKFFAHTAALHADGDIGFSKEYELIQSKSSMLNHTSHHSQHPDNKHKNRYLNITAYDHSRVCLLPSSSCMCEPGKEHRKSCTSKPSAQPSDSPSHCDYVNANFIDGIVAEIDAELAKFIIEQNTKRKLTQNKKIEAAESLNAPSQPTSELWTSVDESQRPFNYIASKTGINDSDMNVSLTSETKNLLSDKSLHDSYMNSNNVKGKLSLDLDKKDDKKSLTPNSDILANTCRLSINLDRKEEKQDEFKTEKIIKESKNKKRSTSADTRDIVVDKKSSSRGHSKNSSVVVAATDSSPSANAPKIEAFLNIEFSGIVDSERELQKAREAEKLIEANKLAKEIAEETLDNLDDLHVQIDGESYRVNSTWLLDRRRYIGTQGPTPGTLPAFWRMVWDHQVVVIVMITNLVERGRRKCDMYWPKEGAETYGIILVNTLKEDVMATYTVRTFQIKNTKLGQSRSVLQYHYTVWPDHGTPEHPLAVLRFREAARKAVPPQAGAVLVHCSAGVGRTGTYIVLDAMLNHLRLTGSLNVFGFLCHVRSQRNFLVQTEEQYVFIHDALLEAIQSGDTEVPVENAKEYLRKLIEPFPEGYVSTFLSNLKCGPYGAPLLEKSNENLAAFPFHNKIKRINSEECDFAMWNNLNDAQYSNDKTLDECRNDIVSLALQEAKAKMESKVDTGESKITCNGDSKDDDEASPKSDSKILVNGNGNNSKASPMRLNNFDNVINEVDEITPENSLDEGDKKISNSDNKSLTPKKDLISDKVDTSSVNSANMGRSDHSTSYEKLNGLCNKVSEESKASSISNDDVDAISNENGNMNKINDRAILSAENSNTITSSISSETNFINIEDKPSSNFSPSQYGPNQDGVESYRKEKTFRNKNDENYELLGGSGRPGGLGGTSVDCFAGAHRFACQKKDTSGKKPKNLLEHQFKLITSFEPSKFHIVSACKQVNASKNRRGCVLPIESGRVHLIPKPGVEGTDYINATWLQGHRSLREYIVTQHPLPNTVGDLYRMLWDHSCQIIVMLSNCAYDPECKSFWPTEKNPELSAYNYNIRYLSEEKFVAKRISMCDLNNKKNLHKLAEDNTSQESPLQSPSSLNSNKGFILKLTKGSQRISPVSSSSSDQKKSSHYSPKEVIKSNDTSHSHGDDNSDTVFYKRQSSNDHQDEERLIPKLDEPPSLEGTEELEELKKLNNEAKSEGYSFDKSELRIETMLNSDSKSVKLSPQKHLANGDPFTPNDDMSKKSQPKSPSKISLKSLRINSPILKSPSKFKFDFGGKTPLKTDDAQGRKSPQNADDALSFEPKFVNVPLLNMSQLREDPEEIGSDCIITTTHISINSVQEDYELKVKLIECPRWLADLDYDENSDTDDDSEDDDYELDEKSLDLDQRLRAYTGVFGLPEYVTRCQDEAKNSPVVIVDKMGGARAVALCSLGGALRRKSRDIYSLAKLHHGRRAGAWRRASDIRALYEALAAYEHPPPSSTSAQVTTQL